MTEILFAHRMLRSITDSIHPFASHSLFLLDWEGDEEVVLLAPPSSSSLGSVLISSFFSSTSIGSGFSSGSSFFTSVEVVPSSVFKKKMQMTHYTTEMFSLSVPEFNVYSLKFSFYWSSGILSFPCWKHGMTKLYHTDAKQQILKASLKTWHLFKIFW